MLDFTPICTPATNAKEAEVDQVYEDLQDPLELTLQKDAVFIIQDRSGKVGIQET